MPSEPLPPLAETVVVILLPLVTLLLQLLLLDFLFPFVWIGFLPAVAVAAWLCGVRGGLLAMTLSVALAEWLLTRPLPGVVLSARLDQGSTLAAAVLFSLLASGAVLLLQRFRRQKFAFEEAAATLWMQRSLPGRPLTDAVDLMRALPAEFAWREAVLAELPIGVAVYSTQGACLRANAAFLRFVALTREEVRAATLFGSVLPIEGLGAAALRMVAVGNVEHQDEVFRGDGKVYRMHWVDIAPDGLIVLSIQEGSAASVRIGAPTAANSATSQKPDAAVQAVRAPTRPRQAQTMTMPPSSASPAALAGLRCLVVDDQRLNRDLLGEILRLEGAIPTLCDSGAEAVATVHAGPAQFDVVLMDIQMPGMDGFEAARQMRGVLGAADLPIFAVTADGAAVNRDALRAADIQGLLGKPLDVDQLIALLRRQRLA